MDAWSAELSTTLAEVWRRLQRATVDRRAPTRFAVLATVGAMGGAEARTVVVRAADTAAGLVEVFTDRRTAKVRELDAEPRATLVFWDGNARLQGRLRATARVLTGPEVLDHWRALPEPARADYAALLPPGTPSEGTIERHPDPDPTHFATVQLVVQEIDTVYLGREAHRRALFSRQDNWQGKWLQP